MNVIRKSVNLWDELAQLKVQNAERYATLFARIVHDAKLFRYDLHEEMKTYDDHVIVCERNRAGSSFIHLVPKEAFPLFRKMQINHSNEFLGFSVLCGRRHNQDLRVSCFGVPCNMLSKALIDFQKALTGQK